MLRKIIFKDETGREMVLPVTPPSYTITTGRNMQVVSLYSVGDYVIPGGRAYATIQLHALLPAVQYPYRLSNLAQSTWVQWLDTQAIGKKKLRLIISGTQFNRQVYLESVSYTESDGTNDLTANLTLREFPTLSVPTTEAPGNATTREVTLQQPTETTYMVQAGDNLWNIAKKFYGDGSLCYKLAAYNGIKNANLISVGQLLKIPDDTTLGATAATQSSAGASSSTPGQAAEAEVPKSTYVLTIEAPVHGVIVYGYTDAVTGQSVHGNGGAALKIGAGTRVTLQWWGKDGYSWSSIVVDGKTQTNSVGYTYLRMNTDRTFAVQFVR